jgi:hypothetical protein
MLRTLGIEKREWRMIKEEEELQRFAYLLESTNHIHGIAMRRFLPSVSNDARSTARPATLSRSEDADWSTLNDRLNGLTE